MALLLSKSKDSGTGMPYKSAKQRAYLHAKKPEVAARFDRDIKAKGEPSIKKAKKKGKR